MQRLLLFIGILLLLAPAAEASTRGKIIRDCSDDGVLQGNYSAEELRDARKNLPSDVAEYTDCSDVLRRAETGGGSQNTEGGSGVVTPGITSGGTGGTGGSAAPQPAPLAPQTPEDQAALDAAQAAPEQEITVGGEKLLAGAEPLRDNYRANSLPTALIVALVLLGLAGLALSIPPLRRRAARWPLGRFSLRRS